MLDKQQKWEVMCAVYDKWSKASDTLIQVKRERNDGSPDWDLFHNDRLSNATTQENKWKMILEGLKQDWPDVLPSVG